MRLRKDEILDECITILRYMAQSASSAPNMSSAAPVALALEDPSGCKRNAPVPALRFFFGTLSSAANEAIFFILA